MDKKMLMNMKKQYGKIKGKKIAYAVEAKRRIKKSYKRK